MDIKVKMLETIKLRTKHNIDNKVSRMQTSSLQMPPKLIQRMDQLVTQLANVATNN